jgi:RHS repeat-associated protein
VDAILQRWYRTDSLQRVTERGGPDSLFQAFTYDSLGRLRSWAKKAERSGTSCVNNGGYGYTCTGPSPWIFSQVTPTYDKVGNPTDAGLNPVTTVGNRLTSFDGVTMTYDADGYMRTRLTSTTTDSLSWDEFGRLVSVKRVGQAQPTTFVYDGFGRRIKKTTATGTTEYLWGGEQLLAELDGSGNVRKTYTYYPGIDQPRSVTTGGQTYFLSTEPDGTVDGVIRKSDRTVVAQYAYTPWGELESTTQAFDSVSNLRWKGLLHDSETGFYYMRARYYDPKIRRFVSEDPIGLQGGINEYLFAGGDPINNSDPSGRDCVTTYVPGSLITTKSNGQEIVVGASDGYYTITCIEQTAHRGGSGYVSNGMVTGEVANGYDEAGQVASNLYAKHLPPACVLSAAQFGAGVGIDTYAALEGGEGIVAGLEAAKSYLRIYTGNFVRKLGGAFAAVVQKQLARAATAHLISANNAFFGSDGVFSQWAQSANSPLAGETTGSSWIPFTGPHVERWKTANENCQE